MLFTAADFGIFCWLAFMLLSTDAYPYNNQHSFQVPASIGNRNISAAVVDDETILSLLPDRFSLRRRPSPAVQRQILANIHRLPIEQQQSIFYGLQQNILPRILPKFNYTQCPVPITPFPQCPGKQFADSESDQSAKHHREYPRLKDIKLIASIGDSITAGMFIRGTRSTVLVHMLGGITEDRSRGAEDAMTFATNIRQFSPDLKGFAVTDTKSGTISPKIPPSELDMAVISTTVSDFIQESKELITRLGTPEFKAIQNEWKMINIFGGGIDVCRSCLPEFQHRKSPEAYAESVDALIQYLYDNLPRSNEDGAIRAHLNLFTLFETPSTIYHLFKDDWWCRRIQKAGDICSCLYESEQQRQELDQLAVAYNNATVQVVRKWQQRLRQNAVDLDTRFRVSVIRVMESMNFSALGPKFISPTDCFHPNECFNRLIAFKAWQIMTGFDDGTMEWKTCQQYESVRLHEYS